ncbi:RNA-binding protein 27, partial [Modicella reniformis]
MHIEEASLADLKAYLTQELTLISDADPAMLADYIIALLKHDKDDSELKSLCITQLEDFLQKATVPFVDALFKVLESKSYNQDQKPASGSQSPSHPTSVSVQLSDYDNDDFKDIPTGPAADRERDRQYDNTSRGRAEKHHRGDSDASDDEDRSYKHARRDDDREISRRHRDYSPSRPSDDDRYSGRNRRPNDYGQSNGHLDHDRRGDRLMRQQHGLSTTGLTSRSANDSNSSDRGHWNTSQQNRNNFDNGSRGNYQDQRGDNGSWRGGSSMRGNRGGMHSGGGFGGQDRPKRQRCRDYDEKGVCMRGDMCSYDHGEDRIVVDEIGRVPFDLMGAASGLGPNGMMGMGANAPPFFPGAPNGAI